MLLQHRHARRQFCEKIPPLYRWEGVSTFNRINVSSGDHMCVSKLFSLNPITTSHTGKVKINESIFSRSYSTPHRVKVTGNIFPRTNCWESLRKQPNIESERLTRSVNSIEFIFSPLERCQTLDRELKTAGQSSRTQYCVSKLWVRENLLWGWKKRRSGLVSAHFQACKGNLVRLMIACGWVEERTQ